MSTAPNAPDKKKRRFGARLRQSFQNIKDSYTISRRTYPWVGWAILIVATLSIVFFIGLAVVTGWPIWYMTLMGVMVAVMAGMVILSWTVRRASYTQIEGHPGAAKAALDQISRGWFVESDPVHVNPKTQDVVWRVIGRPGVVLITEGPINRVHHAVEDEKKVLRRIVSTVPVHVIHVGTGEGQTRLIDLQSTLRKLPTKPTRLTDTEIAQVSKRLSSLSSKGLPIPKGIDPNKVRPDRRAMRGR